MSGYLPKVKVIKNLTQSPRAKHLSRFATILTLPQCLEDASLKCAVTPAFNFCLDKQDPPEGGFKFLTVIIAPSSTCSEHRD